MPSSKTLDFLSKHSILQANSMRYFVRVFDDFDTKKEHLLDVDQVGQCMRICVRLMHVQFRAALRAVVHRHTTADRFEYIMSLLDLIVFDKSLTKVRCSMPTHLNPRSYHTPPSSTFHVSD